MVHPAPSCCPCCGGTKLSKIGEDVTETLDVVPRHLFVTEHVREKFSCRSCEKIAQPPAPFHVISRGFAGPSLLAMILVDKYANHQPLNRQSEQFSREGVDLSVSTMADHVGACAATLLPLAELIKAHVFAAERIHGDDTTVPVLAKVKTKTGRLWTTPTADSARSTNRRANQARSRRPHVGRMRDVSFSSLLTSPRRPATTPRP
jgi:transposase